MQLAQPTNTFRFGSPSPKCNSTTYAMLDHRAGSKNNVLYGPFGGYNFFYDLKKAAAHSLLDWPKSHIEKLNNAGPIELFYSLEMYTRCSHRHAPWWQRDEGHQPEIEELNSVLDYIQEKQVGDFDTQLWLTSGAREVERDWLIPVPKGKDWKKLVERAPAFHNYCIHAMYVWETDEYEYIPLCYIPFGSFRRFGFAFWTSERMAAYGFEPSTARQRRSKYRHHFYSYAWQSILSTEEIPKVENELKQRFLERVLKIQNSC